MIAIIGATGLLGEALLEALHGQPWLEQAPKLFASEPSIGKRLSWGERSLSVGDVSKLDWANTRLLVLAVPTPVAVQYRARVREQDGQQTRQQNCLVLDFSARQLADADTKQLRTLLEHRLTQPDTGLEPIPAPDADRVLAMPAADVWQSLTVLQGLRKKFGLRRVEVLNLLPVSAAGRGGINELARQTANLLNARDIDARLFPQQIAFNSVSRPPGLDEQLASDDERSQQLARLLQVDEAEVSVHSIWTSVFYGLTQRVSFQLASPVEGGADALRSRLERIPGVEWADSQGEAANPVAVANGSELVLSDLRASDASGLAWSLSIHGDALRLPLRSLGLPLIEALLSSG